jgi:hypothetical protein
MLISRDPLLERRAVCADGDGERQQFFERFIREWRTGR